MRRARAVVAVGGAWLLVLGAALVQPACGRQAPDGEAALRAGRYEEAIRALSGAVQGDPANVAARRELARALAAVGRYDEAETAVGGPTGASASTALANVLGEILVARGRTADAEQAFRRALDGGAEAIPARSNLATLLWRRGEREAALKEFAALGDLYERREARSAADLVAVGSALRYLGERDPQRFKDARDAYNEAIAADPRAARPKLRLGELLLEKYNSTDAQALFREVLEANPRDARALLDLAKAKNFDGSDEALELTRKALGINPNLVEARAFLAGLRLGLEDFDGAAAEAERGLAVNPSSPEALAALGAARFLAGDRDGYEAVRRRAATSAPAAADFYIALAELSQQHRRYRVAKDFARQAVEADSLSWRGWGVLGLNQLRTGEIEAARRSLERSFRGDPYNVWIKNTLDLLDTFSRYESRRSARFELFLYGKEAELLYPYMAALAEAAYDSLARRYAFRPATPVRVEVYPSHADFSVRTVGLAGLGALGVSFGNILAMDSPSARDPGDFNWGSTLWHEIAHAFTLGASDGRVPRWLTEGLSVLEERRARPGWGDDVTPSFLLALRDGKLLPPSRLNAGFVRPTYPEQVAHAYYEASLVAEMIEATRGLPAIRAMLAAYGRGERNDDVIRTVLKVEPAAFDKEFDAYLHRRFARQLAALGPAGGEGGGGELARLVAEARERAGAGDRARAIALLERARELFPEYTGADSPNRLLARLYLEQGDRRAAEQALARLVAHDESDLEAEKELAALRESLGDRLGAARALEDALFIYPYAPAVHTHLAELYSALGEPAKAVRERAAVVALDPADRAEALYQLAAARLAAGDRAGAKRDVLRALEAAPDFATAQQLLLKLRAP
ncbi:MAG: tetratricopeptide repeat protein [Gemmatimonadetes bacterium]|nr:tetratricopeptide repeat protein [Gemmatimonadota bacterium]